jgi:hypothetical protein
MEDEYSWEGIRLGGSAIIAMWIHHTWAPDVIAAPWVSLSALPNESPT